MACLHLLIRYDRTKRRFGSAVLPVLAKYTISVEERVEKKSAEALNVWRW